MLLSLTVDLWRDYPSGIVQGRVIRFVARVFLVTMVMRSAFEDRDRVDVYSESESLTEALGGRESNIVDG